MPDKKTIDFTLIDGTLRFVDNEGGLIEVSAFKGLNRYSAQIKSHLIPMRDNPNCQHVMNDSLIGTNKDPQIAINNALLGHFALHHSVIGKLRLVK